MYEDQAKTVKPSKTKIMNTVEKQYRKKLHDRGKTGTLTIPNSLRNLESKCGYPII